MELTLDLRSYRPEHRSHSHDYHQLVLPVSGAMEMAIDHDSGDVTGGKGAVVPAGTEHDFTVRGDNRFIVADVPATLAPELARLPPFIDLDESLGRYILFLERELQRQRGDSSGASAHGQRQMLLLLVRLLTERYGETLKLDRRLEIARDFLDRNIDRPISLCDVALAAHLSTRRLTTLFRRSFGMSPSQYLLEQRMHLAWRLLSRTRLSVQQVAERCGYGNLSAFSSRFSNHFGCSPRQFRRDCAGPANN